MNKGTEEAEVECLIDHRVVASGGGGHGVGADARDDLTQHLRRRRPSTAKEKLAAVTTGKRSDTSARIPEPIVGPRASSRRHLLCIHSRSSPKVSEGRAPLGSTLAGSRAL